MSRRTTITISKKVKKKLELLKKDLEERVFGCEVSWSVFLHYLISLLERKEFKIKNKGKKKKQYYFFDYF